MLHLHVLSSIGLNAVVVVHYCIHINRQHKNMTPLQKGDSSDIYVCLQIKIKLSRHVNICWMKYCTVNLFMEYGCYIHYVFFSHIQWISTSWLKLVSWRKAAVVRSTNSHTYSLMEIITVQPASFITNITFWTCTKIQSIYHHYFDFLRVFQYLYVLNYLRN